jgi:predicted DCC family thiol-disulfide oxidoreductase YuxK
MAHDRALTQSLSTARDRHWIVLYDGHCGFCMWLLAALLRWDRSRRLRPLALQRPQAENMLNELTQVQRMVSWHLISPEGQRWSGGAALPPLLRLLPAGQFPAALLARFPVSVDRSYRWVAEHRSGLSRFVPSKSKQRASAYVRKRELHSKQGELRL